MQVGADILTPGFKKHLEKFYEKASLEDKARCLELLTALDIGQTARQQAQYLGIEDIPPERIQRPRTAMAALGKLKLISEI